MLHFETLSPTLGSNATAGMMHVHPQAKNQPSPNSQLIEISFRSVEFNGQNLSRELDDVIVGQLVEAVRLSDLRDKNEMNINNIAPWVEVGHEDSCQVPILQKKIQKNLERACAQLKRPVPECRLNLSRGEFSIRCYLGRNKPTDHIYNEDLVSDSR
ncbi:MAG: hypothetical protein V3U96_06855 [Paracoccaceae bacterium]